MTSFETSVRIRRPIGDVFEFVADPLNFRHWNSAVRAVWSTHGRERVVGSTYRMERDLPSGRVRNDIKAFAHEYPAEFGIRTMSGPNPVRLPVRILLTPRRDAGPARPSVRAERCRNPVGAARRRAVKHGVEDNLNELKNILETTRGWPSTVAADPPSRPLAHEARKFRSCLHGKEASNRKRARLPLVVLRRRLGVRSAGSRFEARLSHKAVLEVLLLGRGAGRQSGCASRRRDGRTSRDGCDGRFRNPPLEPI
jgi:uncharacterized protein YndB with AHSA1/START domain